MTRAEERARAKRAALKAAQREVAEREALENFVPTPRPTLIARAVQRVLGPPPVDDPSHGRRELLIQRTREGLGLDQEPKAPIPDGAAPDRNA